MEANQKNKDNVEVWWSSEKNPRDISWFSHPSAIAYKLEERAPITLEQPSATDESTIAIFPDITYQEMLGIGTSMEESTIYNLAQMSAAAREKVYEQLLDKSNGAGFDLIRITLGTSDFTAQPFYTYNDLEEGEEDFQLERFSIQKDIDLGIVQTLQRMLEISPHLRIFGSSWTPPAWMKTSGSIMRGELKEGQNYVDALAKYYRKAIQAYQSHGIELYAITVQNEPLLEIDYPSCYMSPLKQKELVIALKKELQLHQLSTEIWIFDHNFSDGWSYVSAILNDSEARSAVDGIAFHDYEGEPTVMAELKAAYPEKQIYMTERSIWGVAAADRIAQYFRNWSSSYNAWVTMLDSNIGTHQWVSTPDPTLLVQNASDREQYWMTPEFYLTAQFSRFIQSGAKRIESNYGSHNTITNVAFLNPDHTIIAVVINQTEEEQSFRIICEGKQITANVPPKSVATYRWHRS